MKEMLCLMKDIIVLEDVNTFRHLKYLVGGLKWFGPESRIIITTRVKHMQGWGKSNMMKL